MKNKPAVGRYVRLLRAPRVDCLGQVVRHLEHGRVLVRVPNWCADGYPMDFAEHAEDVERTTAAACRAAAKAR